MLKHYDVVVIGAGPAGMAAAQQCGAGGASTLLLDEQGSLGGQIYRSVENNTIKDRSILGPDYYKGERLSRLLRQANVDYQPHAKVWRVTPDKEIAFSQNGTARIVNATEIIISTGAQERPFPIPGWTLPGVMNAGAAQILLKTTGLAAENAVFIGSGPLLYLIVKQYLSAGIAVKAVLDTTPLENYWHAAPHIFGAISEYKNILKGKRWIREIKQSGVLYVSGIKELRLNGEKAVTSVEYKSRSQWLEIKTDNVFLHHGVIPNNNLTRSIGCDHAWSDVQHCWHIASNEWGQTTIPGISVAGDSARINGAISAEHQGIVVSLGVLNRLGLLDESNRNAQAKASLKYIRKQIGFRHFLDTLFKPSKQYRLPEADNTIVCRCEEVTAADVREMIEIGCTSPNQCKSYSRCGMGPCQGRFCGITVSEMIADKTNKSMDEVGYYRIRQPIKPLSLKELASLEVENK